MICPSILYHPFIPIAGEISRKAIFETMRLIRDNGGNVIRIWVHAEGRYTPFFHHRDDGVVLGTDRSGSLISDLREILAEAKFVCVFCLCERVLICGGGDDY